MFNNRKIKFNNNNNINNNQEEIDFNINNIIDNNKKSYYINNNPVINKNNNQHKSILENVIFELKYNDKYNYDNIINKLNNEINVSNNKVLKKEQKILSNNIFLNNLLQKKNKLIILKNKEKEFKDIYNNVIIIKDIFIDKINDVINNNFSYNFHNDEEIFNNRRKAIDIYNSSRLSYDELVDVIDKIEIYSYIKSTFYLSSSLMVILNMNTNNNIKYNSFINDLFIKYPLLLQFIITLNYSLFNIDYIISKKNELLENLKDKHQNNLYNELRNKNMITNINECEDFINNYILNN